MRVLLACLALLAVLSCVLGGSPCQFDEGSFYEYDQVLSCFKSIPLSEQVKATTLQTLQRSIELYAFFDIAAHSPDPNLVLNVDMRQGLKQIANRPYYFDKDFHDDLRGLFLQLNDAHTQYYAPQCYQNVLARQGFAPVGWGATPDSYEIKVGPYFPADLETYYQSILNIDLTTYSNWTINTINGVPAYDYFMRYSNSSVGIAKDVGTRFNYALTVVEPRNDIDVIQYGYWQQRTRRNPFPETPVVAYGLTSPSGQMETVSLPWSFKALKTYSDQDDWMADYKSAHVHIGQHEVKMPQALMSNLDHKEFHHFMEPESNSGRVRREQWKQELLQAQFGSAATDMTFELLVNSTHLTFWALSDNATLVLYLDSMAPGRGSGFLPDLERGFEIAKQRGLTQLIIDLSNNGGGNICLGRALLAILQKDDWPGQGQNWGPSDMPLSPLAEQLIRTASEQGISGTIWSPDFYDNQQNQEIAINDTSYMLPGLPHKRGGYLRNYTNLIHIDGCDWGYLIDVAVNFSPASTLIVTNGFCGSTCALFANHMALYDDVRTVVLGGMPGRAPMQYSSFPGGQVMDNGPLFAQLLKLRQDISFVPAQQAPTDYVPRLLATTATFRYCIREMYPNINQYDTSPTEFVFQQADYHLYKTELTALHPQYVWYDVLSLF